MTEAFPLRWPDGWPKTPAAARLRGNQFKRGGWNGTLPTFESGRRDVLGEEMAELSVARDEAVAELKGDDL